MQEDREGHSWSGGGPGAGWGSRLGRSRLWFSFGSVLSQTRLLQDLPPNWGVPSFHKSLESFLPSHPSFQTCFLPGLQTCSHSSYLLPLSLTSECLLWLTASPARSLLPLVGDTQQKALLPASGPDSLGQGLSSLYFK